MVQTGVQDGFSHLAVHVPGLAHTSRVSGFSSEQSAAAPHATGQVWCEHEEPHTPGFTHTSVVSGLSSMQSAFAPHAISHGHFTWMLKLSPFAHHSPVECTV
jgi:hypothetical protein